MSNDNDNHEKTERIHARAYLIWEKEGRPDGHALAHWVKAKEEIEAEDSIAEGKDRSGKPKS
jgi:hypothetical protein